MNRPSRWHSGWPETSCGKGSMMSETLAIRTWLPEICSEYNIVTIADVGCGDRNWMKQTELPPGSHVLSYDFTPRSGDIHKFDCTHDILPMKFDMIMCVYVLNHLYEPADVLKSIHNFRKSGATWLLATFNDVEGFPIGATKLCRHKKKTSWKITREWHYGLFKL